MKKNIFLILHLFLLSYFSIAQKESNKWFFGSNAGVDFNSGAPVAMPGGALVAQEGCASVADNLGNTLFYTNGETVWNSSHAIMPGGTGLLGDNFATQNAIIVPKPGNNNLYYIFTVSMLAGGGFRYHVVDMTVPGGNVISKNTLLHPSVTEKITAVKDQRGGNVWVLIHEWNSNAFYAYLVTKSGIKAPVITNIGVSHALVGALLQNGIGCMKASPDGTKIAAVHYDTRGFELFDFNKCTGVLSNVVSVGGTYVRPYGIEFSPDNLKVYLTNQVNLPPQVTRVTQFDLTAANITASAQLIGTSVTVIPGALQLGPDNKIYLARWNSSWLGVINTPNTLGVASGFVDNGVSLGAMQCKIGLPQTIITTVKTPTANAVVNAQVLCNGYSTGSATVAASSGTPPYTYLWSTTPAQSTATATGLSVGTYTVTVLDSAGIVAALDSTTCNPVIVTITQPAAITATVTSTNICAGGSNGIATLAVSGGIAGYTYSWSPGAATTQGVSNLAVGTYSVLITDANGCTITTIVNITSNPNPTATAASTDTCGINNGTASATPGGGTAPYTYLWSPSGGNNPVAAGLSSGTYTCSITDINGCTATATVSVAAYPQPTANAGADVTITLGQSTTLNASGGGTYSWSPASGLNNAAIPDPIASPSVTTQYCVTVTNSDGCTAMACVNVVVDLQCGELFVPNAFSPNSDGENDEFCLQGISVYCIRDLRVVVYDRWGDIAYESSDKNFCWNGKSEDKLQNTQVYVYYLDTTLIDGKQTTRRGNVSLIR